MINYDHIPREIIRYQPSYPSWGQSCPVPRGWEYRTDAYPMYRTALQDLTVDLCVAGDWLETVSVAENRRILYVMMEEE